MMNSCSHCTHTKNLSTEMIRFLATISWAQPIGYIHFAFANHILEIIRWVCLLVHLAGYRMCSISSFEVIHTKQEFISCDPGIYQLCHSLIYRCKHSFMGLKIGSFIKVVLHPILVLAAQINKNINFLSRKNYICASLSD